ncbi:MAG: hypothetical protein JJ979_20835 [Roseibium sp.]|nr:hypothetical protein [Roseibium sp.]
MQSSNDLNNEPTVAEKLTHIVNKMLEPYGKRILLQSGLVPRPPSLPFDTSKPNEHDSKSEFQRELEAVKGGLKGLKQAINSIAGGPTGSKRAETFKHLRPIIDAKFKSNADSSDLKSSLQLIRKNVADVGGFACSFLIMLDLKAVLEQRLEELKDQEDKFWNVAHRPPDYYARAIALRLARLFARETGEYPTFGTSGDTGDPSTSYTRALKAVYSVLGINADVRAPATWAIDKISERDLAPEPEGIFGGLLGLDSKPEEVDQELRKYLEKTYSTTFADLPPLPPLPGKST